VTTVDPEVLAPTRRSLHAVAEHVLAAALHRSTGRIGLRATPGGFGTPEFDGPDGLRQVRVDGLDLVVVTDGTERRQPLTTVGAAAAMVGVEPGAPARVYPPATPLEPDRPLALDRAGAAQLADLFAAVDDALDRLVAEASSDDPATVQLWPEHFDLATTIREVNYGGSPGDDEHPLPYLYVGPWSPPEPDGGFWNEAFGASRAAPGGLTPDEALAFFADGCARLGARH
jgi:hypothetical protein